MEFLRRAFLVSMLAVPAACGGGGGGGGGGSPPPPPPPPAAVITGPATTLPASARNVPLAPISFTATGTAPFSWTVTAGLIPPGLTLSPSGVYSGTPTAPGSYFFTVTLTDANGTDAESFSHVVLASAPESEPNDSTATADLLPAGVAGTGTLGVNDDDYWTFSATLNDYIQVEVFGPRNDFAGWDGNTTIPRISVIDSDGATFLIGHDRSLGFVQDVSTGWQWGSHDMDVPRFRIPLTGNYFLRLQPDLAGVAGGAYAVRVTVISSGGVQFEIESNATPATATPITPGVIDGFHSDNDLDFFSFSVTGPTLVTFEVSSYRNGVSGTGAGPDDDYFDPQMVLVAPDQATGLTGNDDAYFYDSKVTFLITTAETYYLLVYESDFQTAGDADYVLTFTAVDASSPVVETEANEDTSSANPISYGSVVAGFADLGLADVDFFSFSGTAGDMVRIYWSDFGTHQSAADFIDLFLMFDDVNVVPQINSFWGVSGENAVRAILPATGTYYVRVAPYSGATVSTDYLFQLVLLKAGTFETEGNDARVAANAVPGSGRVAGVIGSAGDVDVFSFSAAQGEVVVFSIHAGPPDGVNGSAGTLLNSFYTGTDLLSPDLEILAADGTVLGTTPYFGGSMSGEGLADGAATAGIAFVAPSAGTFYIRVSDATGFGSAELLYLLEKR